MKSSTLFLTSLFLSVSIIPITIAQESRGSISGHIWNSETGLPIPDANIIVENSIYGSASGDGGYYFIENLPIGASTLSIKVMGYQNLKNQNVSINRNTIQDFSLVPEIIQLNPIVVTGTGSDHLQHSLSVSSEIFTTLDFQEQNGHTAAEMIESSGGVYVRDYGGFAGIKSLSIRGAESSQVLVLLDGQKLNSPRDGIVDINAIPIEALDRIEVIRGGHSAFYGTNAIGGTIQLITKESLSPKGYTFGLRSTLGSFKTKGYSAWGSFRIGPFQNFISYNGLESNGDFGYCDPVTMNQMNRENNDYKTSSLFIKSKCQITKNGTIKAIYQSIRSKRGSAGSITWPSPLARRDEKMQLASLQLNHQITNHFRLKANAFAQASDHSYQDPGGWTPVDDHHETTTIGFDTQGRWTFNSNVLVNLGGEWRRDHIKSTTVGGRKRELRSLFLQGELDLGLSPVSTRNLFKWIPAIRLDNYSDVGSFVSPKLGISIKPDELKNIIIRGNIGQAFRVPTFNDLYWPEDFYSIGNPDLQVETSTNWDVGVVYQTILSGLFQWEITYFSNHVQNLIQWQPVSESQWSPVNIGKSSIAGFENIWTIRLPGNVAHMKVSNTWMNATDKTLDSVNYGNRLIYHPNLKLDVNIGFSIRPVHLNLAYRYVDKQVAHIDNNIIRPHYQILNGNIGTDIALGNLKMEANLQIFNILDKRLVIMEGYPMPGREFRFSLGFTY